MFLQVVNTSLFGGSIFFYPFDSFFPSLHLRACHISSSGCVHGRTRLLLSSLNVLPSFHDDVQAEISHLIIPSRSDSVLTLTHCHFFVSFQRFGSFKGNFCSILKKQVLVPILCCSVSAWVNTFMVTWPRSNQGVFCGLQNITYLQNTSGFFSSFFEKIVRKNVTTLQKQGCLTCLCHRTCLARQWLHPWTPASWDQPAQPTADPHHAGPLTLPPPPPSGARPQRGGALSHRQGPGASSRRMRSQRETFPPTATSKTSEAHSHLWGGPSQETERGRGLLCAQ